MPKKTESERPVTADNTRCPLFCWIRIVPLLLLLGGPITAGAVEYGADILPLLEDRSWVSKKAKPYDMTEITDRLPSLQD